MRKRLQALVLILALGVAATSCSRRWEPTNSPGIWIRSRGGYRSRNI